MHVEQQNIRLQLEGLRDGLVAVGGITDHIEAAGFSEHVAHADANYRMIVCQNNSNRSFHLSGKPPKTGFCLHLEFCLKHTL